MRRDSSINEYFTRRIAETIGEQTQSSANEKQPDSRFVRFAFATSCIAIVFSLATVLFVMFNALSWGNAGHNSAEAKDVFVTEPVTIQDVNATLEEFVLKENEDPSFLTQTSAVYRNGVLYYFQQIVEKNEAHYYCLLRIFPEKNEGVRYAAEQIKNNRKPQRILYENKSLEYKEIILKTIEENEEKGYLIVDEGVLKGNSSAFYFYLLREGKELYGTSEQIIIDLEELILFGR